MDGKVFSLRFDIDTPDCLVRGTPGLMKLAERLGVRFTFFLSVGKSISRRGTLSRRLKGVDGVNGVNGGAGAAPVTAAGFPARRKLGNLGYLKLAVLNPDIGRAHGSLVRDLARSQEMGLHGGRNHETWHRGCHGWPRRRLEEELDWALAALAGMDVAVSGFSCPGWSEPPGLVEALEERKFLYRADRHGPDATGVRREGRGLLNVGTNILGEPGGVAYLEHLRASGLSDAEMRETFRRNLEAAGPYAVAYDHPYYAGVSELRMVEDFVKIAADMGYQVRTLGEIAGTRSACAFC
jgi:hypothetical protein